MEVIQKQLQSEIESFKVSQKEYQKALTQRQQLDAQFNENSAVKTELDLLKEGAEVFKLIGPVLVKQDVSEAKQNVAKRMDYIGAELKRVENLITTLESKQSTQKDKVVKLQEQLQKEQMKAATKL